MGASPKCRVPFPKKDADPIATFKTDVTDRIRALLPPTNTKPIRLFAHDERRWNLRTIRRRRITARGVKPAAVTQSERGGCWLYGGMDPDCGDAFWLILPQLNATNMHIFLDRFAAAYADSFTRLLLDNARAHTAKTLRIPANVALLFQPAHCPELNPAERVWEDRRAKRAWQRLGDIDLLEDERSAHVRAYGPATRMS